MVAQMNLRDLLNPINRTTLQLLYFSAIALLMSPFLLPFLFLSFIFLAFNFFLILPFWVILVSPCLVFKIVSLDMKLKKFLGAVQFGGSSSSKKPVSKGPKVISDENIDEDNKQVSLDLDESWELPSLNDSDEEKYEKDDEVEESRGLVPSTCEKDSWQFLAPSPKSTSKPDHQSFGEVLSFWRIKEKEGK